MNCTLYGPVRNIGVERRGVLAFSRLTDVSIIIVNWNTRDLLLDCLRGLYESVEDAQVEVIVVDNGSVDGSVDAVKREYPKVLVVENEYNVGFAKANNIGMSISTGRYVCLVNSDIVFLDPCFSKLCKFMDNNAEVGMIGPRLVWPDLRLQDSCRKFPSLWNNLCSALWLNRLFPKSAFFSGEHMMYSAHDKTIEVDSLVGAFLMVRREALDQVGMFDERFFIYAEEVDWTRRFHKVGWKVVFLSDVEVIHVGRGSSSKEPLRFSREQQKAKLQYWSKHHSRGRRTMIWLIMLLHHIVRLSADVALGLVHPSRRIIISRRLKESLFCIRDLMRPSHVNLSANQNGRNLSS